MRYASLLAPFLLLFIMASAPGCAGPQSAAEAREDPGAVAGQQRAVLRGTAMRDQSGMGGDLLEALRAATEAPRADTDATSPVRFNTLLAALDAAGLSDLLQREGPYTLFAPTDDAFRRLAPERLEALLEPENREQLRHLLRAHLVEGDVVADELVQRSPVATLAEGRRLTVEGEDQNITVGGTRVLQADAGTANGTIHVVDAVLVPPGL